MGVELGARGRGSQGEVRAQRHRLGEELGAGLE